MNEETLDIDRYFARIGFTGPCAPDLATLRALHERHPRAIPFENLDPLLGRPIELTLPALESKLIRSHRGGYCFEQNLLFWNVLEQIGFQVSGLSGRVLWNRSINDITPQTHMLLRVEIDESTYLADVGFGGTTLTAPLKLVLDEEQETPHERFRLRDGPLGFLLEAKLANVWSPLYQFDLSPQFPVDYSITNHFLGTHENSHFRRDLFVARPGADGTRFALRNNRFSKLAPTAPAEIQYLTSVQEATQILDEIFGIHLPDPIRFATIWERFLSVSAPQ